MEQFLDILVDEVAIGVVKVLSALLMAGVTYLFGILGMKVKAWLEARLTNDQIGLLKTGADMVVRYLQQSAFLGLLNEEKKERAVLWLKDFVAEKGLPFSDEDIDKAIEAAVLTMKQGWELGKK